MGGGGNEEEEGEEEGEEEDGRGWSIVGEARLKIED